jgi:phosphosulfolactate synthase
VTSSSLSAYLAAIGVRALPACTSVFDPGYDPATTESHLDQSAHLMATLKISMACWQIADQAATERKTHAARRAGVPAVAGGGPFEVAVAQGALPAYLDLCAGIGLSRIECSEGFTGLQASPAEVVEQAGARGLEVQYELGEKHSGAFTDTQMASLIDRGREWIDAGAPTIVVEGREDARDVGLFSSEGDVRFHLAERLVEAFGLEWVVFEAPTKATQFALIDHFGPDVRLGNVRLEELLRVEIYRRGLHSDAYRQPHLRPQAVR